MSWKAIALDDATRKFLGTLRSARREAGLTLRELASAIGAPLGTVKMYELGLNLPSLGILMRLADLFGYDLSASVNYKVYHGQICPCKLKRSLRRYALSYGELSRLTGYATANIYASVNQKSYGSIECLSAVLEVLRHERELEAFRAR